MACLSADGGASSSHKKHSSWTPSIVLLIVLSLPSWLLEAVVFFMIFSIVFY